MSTKDDYKRKLKAILAVEGARLKSPVNIPVGVYAQEADNLYRWCQGDKKKLTALGLDWELVKDLPERTGALREAEALWNKQRFAKKDAVKEWERLSPAAYELRDEILNFFRFAFRKDVELLEKVKLIGKDQGQAGLVQGLNDLSVLGKGQVALLEKANFDMVLLDRAAEDSVRLSRLLAEVNSERNQYNEAKVIRDKAYSYLKEAVDEIYSHGQFAFRKDEERFRGYRSQYMYARRARYNRKSAAKEDQSLQSLQSLQSPTADAEVVSPSPD